MNDGTRQSIDHRVATTQARGMLDDVWGALVTTALLGTDRRDPPQATGAVAGLLGDLALVAGDSTPDTQFLDHVAAVTIARRAAARPAAAASPLAPPPHDDRPLCRVAAVAMWHRIVAEWPVLEDEWLVLALRHRVALPGDVLVELLDRHRRDAGRTALVAAVGGPVVEWLADHVPAVAGHVPTVAAATRADVPAPYDGPAGLAELPIPVELEPLLTTDAATFAGTLRGYLETGQLDATHRRVLTHLMARCRTAVLDETIDVLTPLAAYDAVAATVVDIARCRRDLLTSFEAPPSERGAGGSGTDTAR